MEMQPEGGFVVGGTGEPGETGADTVEPVASMESFSCERLREKVIGWATVVAAAGASADPVPTSVDTAKTEAKAFSAAGKARL